MYQKYFIWQINNLPDIGNNMVALRHVSGLLWCTSLVMLCFYSSCLPKLKPGPAARHPDCITPYFPSRTYRWTDMTKHEEKRTGLVRVPVFVSWALKPFISSTSCKVPIVFGFVWHKLWQNGRRGGSYYLSILAFWLFHCLLLSIWLWLTMLVRHVYCELILPHLYFTLNVTHLPS